MLGNSMVTLFTVIALCLLPSYSMSQESSISERKREFDSEVASISRSAISLGREEARRRVVRLFEEVFSGTFEEFDPGAYPIDDLHMLFEALNSVVHKTFSNRESELLFRVVMELYNHPDLDESELPADPNPAQRAYDTLLNAKQMELATELANSFGKRIDALPYSFPTAVSSDPDPKVYTKSDDGSLRIDELELDHGNWLVAVVHPGCAFSRRAMRYVDSNFGDLKALMPENVVWVSGQSYTYTLPWIERWNRNMDSISIQLSALDSSWPDDIVLRLTPAFYGFKEGELVGKTIGWTGDSSIQDFMSLLSSLKRNEDIQHSPD